MRRLLVLAALASALAPAPAAVAEQHEAASGGGAQAAEPAAWDGARVAEIAGQLREHAVALRDSARAQPTQNLGSGQERARFRYMDTLRLIANESRHLADEAGGGGDREQTRPVFQRLDELTRDAAEEARRMFLPQATLDRIQQARALMQELRIFYTGAPDDRPALVGPSRSDRESP